jgi:hypothetical protein
VVCCVLEGHLQRDSKAVKALRNLRRHKTAAAAAAGRYLPRSQDGMLLPSHLTPPDHGPYTIKGTAQTFMPTGSCYDIASLHTCAELNMPQHALRTHNHTCKIAQQAATHT